MLNAALHAQPFFAGLVLNMNINSYKATEMIMEALNTFLLTATIIKIYTCECCISVSLSVCHTFVSVTYLPNA